MSEKGKHHVHLPVRQKGPSVKTQAGDCYVFIFLCASNSVPLNSLLQVLFTQLVAKQFILFYNSVLVISDSRFAFLTSAE